MVKGTVGYNESDNKTEFIKGANVAYSRLSKHYKPIIDAAIKDRDYWKELHQKTLEDMHTLTRIIERYTPE